jgi:hypothetical protein
VETTTRTLKEIAHEILDVLAETIQKPGMSLEQAYEEVINELSKLMLKANKEALPRYDASCVKCCFDSGFCAPPGAYTEEQCKRVGGNPTPC